MDKTTYPEFFECTAGDVAAELARRGVPPGQRVIIALETDDWVAQARAYSRPLIQAEGLTDEDIDRIIDQERTAVAKECPARRSRAVVDMSAEEIDKMTSAHVDREHDHLDALLNQTEMDPQRLS